QTGFDRAHFGAFNGVVRTDSRRDFRRHTVLAKGKPGLLKGPASYGKRSGINHPIKRTIGTRFYDRGPAVLQFWVPVCLRECDLACRYMAIGIPCLDHVYLKLREIFCLRKLSVSFETSMFTAKNRQSPSQPARLKTDFAEREPLFPGRRARLGIASHPSREWQRTAYQSHLPPNAPSYSHSV